MINIFKKFSISKFYELCQNVICLFYLLSRYFRFNFKDIKKNPKLYRLLDFANFIKLSGM